MVERQLMYKVINQVGNIPTSYYLNYETVY